MICDRFQLFSTHQMHVEQIRNFERQTLYANKNEIQILQLIATEDRFIFIIFYIVILLLFNGMCVYVCGGITQFTIHMLD